MSAAQLGLVLSPARWKEVADLWDQREVNVPLREALRQVAGVDLPALERLLEPTEEPLHRREIAQAIENGFRAAATIPGASVLLALYLYGECLRAWEESDDYLTIGEVIGGVATASKRVSVAGAEGELLGWIVPFAQQSLTEAMAVESGLNCSCPFEMMNRAHNVVAAAGEAKSTALDMPDEFKAAYALVRNDAAVTFRYFELVERVARAVFDFDVDQPDTVNALRSVVKALTLAEKSDALVGDVYGTELRAHRRSLEGLLAGLDRSALKVKSATIVYCYPFALELDPTEALATAGRRFGTGEVHKTALTDAWRGDDPLGRQYLGVTVLRPSLHVIPTYRDAAFDASAEVRLSSLGNHYVRVEARLDNEDMHGINQALRRVSRNMGEEEIDAGGTGTWSRLATYAVDTIREISEGLGTASVESVERSFHVVLNVRSLAVVEPGGIEREAALDDLPTTLGSSLLLNPTFRPATALEEWVRSSAGPVENLLSSDGLAGELAVRTAHCTLLWLPDAPAFLLRDYEQMAEFAATVPGLLYRWQHKLGVEAGELAKEMESLRRKGPADPASGLTSLQERELRLRTLESEVRELVAFLHSPNLVRTHGYRRFLDALYAASSLAAQEDDLRTQLAVLGGQYDRVSAITAIMVNRQAQDHAEAAHRRDVAAANIAGRADDKLKIVVAVLAGSSVSGILNLFKLPSWLDLSILGLVLVAVTVFSIELIRARPSGGRDPGPPP